MATLERCSNVLIPPNSQNFFFIIIANYWLVLGTVLLYSILFSISQDRVYSRTGGSREFIVHLLHITDQLVTLHDGMLINTDTSMQYQP